MRIRTTLIRSNTTGVSDPRLKFSQIRPGLGDPAPYCNCNAKPNLVSNNFVTLLVSMQYLLILCKKYCDSPKGSITTTTTTKSVLEPVEGRSNEIEDAVATASGGEYLLDDILSRLTQSVAPKKAKSTTTTRTTTTTTTTTTITTTTTTTTTTNPYSIFEKYFSSMKDVGPILENYFLSPPSSSSSPSPEEEEEDESGNRVKKSRVPDKTLGGKRWRALSCPTYCPKEVEPVCGSDGVIYKNDCDMRKRTCNRDVKAVELTECALSQGSSKCEHKCDKDKDLVCGTDGRTYLNKCFLQVEFCERGIEFAHYGSCLNSTALGEKCPKSCSPTSTSSSSSKGKKESSKGDPVCGSDGNVYQSECEMKLQTCGQGVVVVDRRHCQTTEHCDSGCWKISRLTCGSDGKLYNNGCQMLRKNCGKHVFEVPVPYCLNKMYRTDCPLNCTGHKEEPVCASDENIYKNLCEMKKMTCGFPLTRYERIVKVDFALCASKAATCAQMQCPPSDPTNEICGNDGITYRNACELGKATCASGVQKAHVGTCTDLNSNNNNNNKDSRDNNNNNNNCPKECPDAAKEDKPVCGSDGNTYKSDCDMRLKTCGQRVSPAPSSHCRSTQYCDADCPAKAKGKMVCGSDAKFYDSLCDMKKKNCGRHVFVSPISLCLQNFNFKFSGCGRVCPDEYDPVCGSDEKTYSNQCFMEMENCRARSLGGVDRKYFGKCGEPKQSARHYLYRK